MSLEPGTCPYQELDRRGKSSDRVRSASPAGGLWHAPPAVLAISDDRMPAQKHHGWEAEWRYLVSSAESDDDD